VDEASACAVVSKPRRIPRPSRRCRLGRLRQSLAVAVLGALPGMGAAAPGLVIEPLAVRIDERPGQEVRGHLSVVNAYLHPVRLRVSWSDASPMPVDRSWLVLEESALDLAPRERGRIPYRVRIPEGTSGQLLARIRFAERPESTASVVGVRTRLSILLAAVARGTERYGAELVDIQPFPGRDVLWRTYVRNIGNVYIKPTGSVWVTSAESGRRVAAGVINEGRSSVHPRQTRALLARLDRPLPPGHYRFQCRLSVGAGNRTVTQTFQRRLGGDAVCTGESNR